jgi:lipopolysaccharide biosynthesis glycosyltransferase
MNAINLIPVEICYGIDETDALFATVSMETLIRASDNSRHYDIHILTSGLSKESQARILALKKNHISFYFHDVSKWAKEKLQGLSIKNGERLSDYYRFFVSDYFLEIDKVLYVGWECYFEKDAALLYDYRSKNHAVVGFHEKVVDVDSAYQTYYEKALGISHRQVVNASLLLMNLKVLRQMHLMDGFLLTKDFYAFDVTPVTDYLNVLLNGRIGFYPDHLAEETVLNQETNERHLVVKMMSFEKKPWDDLPEIKGFDFWYVANLNPHYALMKLTQYQAALGQTITPNYLRRIHGDSIVEYTRVDNYASRLEALKKVKTGASLSDLFFIPKTQD